MFNKVISTLIIALLLVLLPHVVHGVEVKKIEIQLFEDFQKGEFKGTSLDSKGRLFIGPQLKFPTNPPGEYFLALDTATNGDIYVGTGHNAAVYKIKATATTSPTAEGNAGNIENIFTADEDLDVYALAVKENGDVFAASSPDGKIYKITKNNTDKKGTEFFNPGEKFIWDMKLDQSGNLICAMGLNGGVYRVDPAGDGVQIFAAEDTHIVSICITRNNSILAGSGDRGVIYRIDNRKAKVLFDSPFEEIRGICEDKDGNIYFSATKGLSSSIMSKIPEMDAASKKTKPESDGPVTMDKSALYRIDTNGVVVKIWSSRKESIYALTYDEKNNSVLIGTGDRGRLYRVDKDRGYSLVYESDSAQIFKISNTTEGFTFASNNTAALTQISNNPNRNGTFFSDIYDLQIQSRIGRIYWEAQTPTESSVQLFVRTGNSSVPDSSWSQWSAPFTNSENSSVQASNCRYFQVKASLNSGTSGQTPVLESIKVFYIQSNLSPRLKKITLTKYAPPPSKSQEEGHKVVESVQAALTNRLMATWEAEDLNKDTLKYNVAIKKYDNNNWISIKEDLQQTTCELNPQLYQDGKYQLRITADDSLSNPPAMAQSHALISSPFLIDSTAPVISGFSAANKKITFTVTDLTSIIAKVLYSFDGKLWYPVFPTDMLNDSKSESFDFTLNSAPKGFILIKVADEFGNSKVFQEEI